ncbi:MAG TPA: T9SS type A sorting domain-containing protein [Flavobacteriales bacterium]|nr:T9SS type A sorting domain-containing protein [Flavobacteriales bacterium]
MNTRSHFATLCCAAALFTFLPAAQAQFFIPDQLERDWLNAEIPGIVDAGGIMDTLHPGIAALDSAMLVFTSIPTSIDLVGIAYLDALERFTFVASVPFDGIEGHLPITIAAFPSSLRRLQLQLAVPRELEVHLPAMPVEMDWIEADMTFASSWLDIAALPDSAIWLEFVRVDSLSWGATGYTDYLNLEDEWMDDPTNVTIPPITAGRINLNDMYVERLDMSAVVTYDLWTNRTMFMGTMEWPLAERIYFSGGGGELAGDPSPFRPGLEFLSTDLCVIRCLPTLPEGLLFLDDHYQMIPCLPNWPAGMEFSSGAVEPVTQENAHYCSVLNSNCPGAYPGVAGRVFADVDGDGAYDSGEPGLPQTQVTLQPNSQVTGCLQDGTWEVGVPPGTYTITAGSGYPYIQVIAPVTHGASVPNMGDTDLNNDFAVTLTPDIQDLRVSLYAEPARPGFDNRLYLTCQNYGTTTVDATLILNYDGDQSWVASSLAPSSSAGTTATWSIPAMPIGTTTTISVDLNTAASVALGTDIEHMLSADPIATDETPANNTTQFTDSVVGSFDPNDKLLQPSVLSPAQVQLEEKPIEYTIRFQNTGTFLAERVVILDTLSEDLQWASMQFIASSHACHWYITDGVLHVIHNDIMLPDSTSDEANSHGFVKFSMLPANDLQDGAEVVNIAHIVFDFNAPIITPPAVFTVDMEAGVEERSANNLTVFPNPAKDLLHVGTPTHTRGVITYTVEDILGKRLLQGTLGNAAQIAVGGLANGVYNLTIHGGGQREIVRFVKE